MMMLVVVNYTYGCGISVSDIGVDANMLIMILTVLKLMVAVSDAQTFLNAKLDLKWSIIPHINYWKEI